MKFLARLFILLGIAGFILASYLIWERNNPNRLAFKNYVGNYKNVKASNPPTRIIIRDLSIDIPIYPAKVVTDQWETTSQGASYLLSSPIPGARGNSIIYAHDWVSLFGPLLSAKAGQKVEIQYEDKSKKIFTIQSTSVVPSDRASILAPTDDKRITLYTCTGFLDSQRMVAVATLTNPL